MSLSVEEFGQASQVISLGGIYILILLSGLDESIAKRCFTLVEEKHIYITNGFLLLTINALFFLVLCYFYKEWLYAKIVGSSNEKIIGISVILVVLSPFFLTYSKILRLTQRSTEFFVFTILTVAVQVTLLLTLVVYSSAGIEGYLLAYAITALLNCVYVFIRVGKLLKFEYLSISAMKLLLSYGLKIAPHTIASWGLFAFTIVFIGKSLGSEASASLVTINYIPLIASVVSFAFFYTYQPWLYENLKNATRHKEIIAKIKLFCLAFAGLLVVLLLSSKMIYDFLFDDRYVLDLDVLVVLLIATFFQFSGSLFTYLLYYYEQATKYVALSTLLGVATNVVGFFIFVPLYGIMGAVLSFLLAQIIIFSVRIFVGLRVLSTV